MSKTPITDANEFEIDPGAERVVPVSVARQLEEQRNDLLAALGVAETYLSDLSLGFSACTNGRTSPQLDATLETVCAAIAAAKEGAK